jgi:hypothetical protein
MHDGFAVEQQGGGVEATESAVRSPQRGRTDRSISKRTIGGLTIIDPMISTSAEEILDLRIATLRGMGLR